jgi:hypothetical protein
MNLDGRKARALQHLCERGIPEEKAKGIVEDVFSKLEREEPALYGSLTDAPQEFYWEAEEVK